MGQKEYGTDCLEATKNILPLWKTVVCRYTAEGFPNTDRLLQDVKKAMAASPNQIDRTWQQN